MSGRESEALPKWIAPLVSVRAYPPVLSVAPYRGCRGRSCTATTAAPTSAAMHGTCLSSSCLSITPAPSPMHCSSCTPAPAATAAPAPAAMAPACAAHTSQLLPPRAPSPLRPRPRLGPRRPVFLHSAGPPFWSTKKIVLVVYYCVGYTLVAPST
jgi:hypothetical protein